MLNDLAQLTHIKSKEVRLLTLKESINRVMYLEGGVLHS